MFKCTTIQSVQWRVVNSVHQSTCIQQWGWRPTCAEQVCAGRGWEPPHTWLYTVVSGVASVYSPVGKTKKLHLSKEEELSWVQDGSAEGGGRPGVGASYGGGQQTKRLRDGAYHRGHWARQGFGKFFFFLNWGPNFKGRLGESSCTRFRRRIRESFPPSASSSPPRGPWCHPR